MRLDTASASAPDWAARTGTGTLAESAFRRPLLGAPCDHECEDLVSSRLALSVIVPSWNGLTSLDRCLAAMEHSSLNRRAPHRLEVVVCDDGSTDGTWDHLGRAHGGLNLTSLRLEHRSQAHALNVGLTRARGQVVVFCDADMILGCGALDELAARHEAWDGAVCSGFRSDLSASPKLRDPGHLWRLMHSEAMTRDNRVRFHMPTLVENMLDATDWLTRLGSGRMFVDCEGSQWRRHRFTFGCLFSAERSLVNDAAGMPDIVPRWGYQDTLLAARLEAAGGFLLPVTSAWGHHIQHNIRHADQWFQYDRNRLAYEHILAHDLDGIPWRDQAGEALVLGERRARGAIHSRAAPSSGMPADTVNAGPAVWHALGLWERCLTAAQAGSDQAAGQNLDGNSMLSECLFRLGRYEETGAARPSAWQALALNRLGRPEAARAAARAAALAGNRIARYVLDASAPELSHLADLMRDNGLASAEALYREATAIIGTGTDRRPAWR